MKRFFENNIVQVIILCIVTFLFSFVGQLLGAPLMFLMRSTGNDALEFMGHYMMNLGTWILVFIIWIVIKKYRCLFNALGPKAKGNKLSTSLIIGLIFGLGMNLFLAIVAMLNGDIKLSFNEINVAYIVGFIIAVGIQSGAEELVMRVHVYQNLRRIFPKSPAVAIIGNAVLFVLLHIANPGINILALINLFASGILLSLIVFYFDSFWGAVAAHTGWNFCQSILLGLPNSGIVSEYSVFKLDAASARNSFAYDVGFGIEGTVARTVLYIIACAIIIVIGRKRNQKPFDVWADAVKTTVVANE